MMQLRYAYKYYFHCDVLGYPRQSTSTGVDIFFSLIFSYFCFFVAAFKPCQGRLPRLKYIKTYPKLSKSSLLLCSVKERQTGWTRQATDRMLTAKSDHIKGICVLSLVTSTSHLRLMGQLWTSITNMAAVWQIWLPY